MKYALIIFTFVISVCSAQFGNNQSMSKTGTTVAQFLKIGMGARSTGMGGAVAGQKAILSGVYIGTLLVLQVIKALVSSLVHMIGWLP